MRAPMAVHLRAPNRVPDGVAVAMILGGLGAARLRRDRHVVRQPGRRRLGSTAIPRLAGALRQPRVELPDLRPRAAGDRERPHPRLGHPGRRLRVDGARPAAHRVPLAERVHVRLGSSPARPAGFLGRQPGGRYEIDSAQLASCWLRRHRRPAGAPRRAPSGGIAHDTEFEDAKRTLLENSRPAS